MFDMTTPHNSSQIQLVPILNYVIATASNSNALPEIMQYVLVCIDSQTDVASLLILPTFHDIVLHCAIPLS